jgi:uncharacterized protein
LRLKPLKTLQDFNCPPHIIEHSKTVSVKALDMAYNLMDNHGYTVDLQIIETGAILHDIGRTETHTIKHAIEGAKILTSLNFPKEIIDITRKHIGAGIPSKEAELLGLPPGDYMPNTLEEKIVAHADNLIMGTTEVNLDFVIVKWKKQFGDNHTSIYRIKKLHKELNP